MSAQSTQPSSSSGWLKIRTERGKLLSRYHPIKNLMEFKVGKFFYYVDLDEYKENPDMDVNNLASMNH